LRFARTATLVLEGEGEEEASAAEVVSVEDLVVAVVDSAAVGASVEAVEAMAVALEAVVVDMVAVEAMVEVEEVLVMAARRKPTLHPTHSPMVLAPAPTQAQSSTSAT
jgi:hypothetical protein